MCESKPSRPSDDAVSLRKEIISAIKRSDEQMEGYSKRRDEKMDNPLQSITNSVGTHLRETQPSKKMKQEGDDRYKQIYERIAKHGKRSSP